MLMLMAGLLAPAFIVLQNSNSLLIGIPDRGFHYRELQERSLRLIHENQYIMYAYVPYLCGLSDSEGGKTKRN